MKTAQEKKKKEAVSGGAAEASPSGHSGDAEGLQSVDRIRDIIFGAQMRDYEARFKDLESRLLQKAEELRSHVDQGFAALSKKLADAVSAASQDLKSEQKSRADSEAEAARRLEAVRESLQKKLDSQGGAADQHFGRLEKNLDETAKRLAAEFQAKAKDLQDRLEAEVSRLGSVKTDRAKLAEMLREVAGKLSEK